MVLFRNIIIKEFEKEGDGKVVVEKWIYTMNEY